MFPPAPAITYTFPATFLTTSSTGDINLGSSQLCLKPRLSGIRPRLEFAAGPLQHSPRRPRRLTLAPSFSLNPSSESLNATSRPQLLACQTCSVPQGLELCP